MPACPYLLLLPARVDDVLACPDVTIAESMHLGGELLPPRRSAQGLQVVYAVVADFAHDAGTGGHSGGERFYNVQSSLDAFRLVVPEKPAGGFRIVWPSAAGVVEGQDKAPI